MASHEPRGSRRARCGHGDGWCPTATEVALSSAAPRDHLGELPVDLLLRVAEAHSNPLDMLVRKAHLSKAIRAAARAAQAILAHVALDKLTKRYHSVPPFSSPGVVDHSKVIWTGAVDDALVLEVVERCPGLTSLSLRGCTGITPRALRAFGWDSACQLKVLDLRGTLLSLRHERDLQGWCASGGCARLTSLCLRDCVIADEGLVAVAATVSGRLTSLCVTDCRQLTDVAATALAEHCAQLRALRLGGCSKVTDGGVQAIAHGCEWLEALDLQQLRNLTDSAIAAVAARCPRLANLRLSCVGSQLTDASVQALASGCAHQRLTALDLSRNRNLTDGALAGLAASCTRLEVLDLGGCHQITDAAVFALASSSKWLRELRLRGCGGITDAAVVAAVSGCARLATLDLRYCTGLSSHAARNPRCLTESEALLVGIGGPLFGPTTWPALQRIAIF